MKIANDVRWLASGPRAGLAEISILKMNQVHLSCRVKLILLNEMLTMVAVQVMGNDILLLRFRKFTR